MRTPVIMISLLAAGIAPVLAETEVAPEQRPTYIYKSLAGDPHAGHAVCHGKYWSLYSHCAGIRQSEIDAHEIDSASGTQVEVIDKDGVRDVGRRDTYSTTAVTGFTSDTSASAAAWLHRYKPLAIKLPKGTPARPEYETAGVNSCDEYAYKRFYQANRHLDAIGTLTSAKRYTDAVDVILDGVPATLTSRQLPAVSSGLADFDGRSLSAFDDTITGYPLANLEPPAVQNPFFAMPSTLVKSAPAQGEAWEPFLDAALARASSRTVPASTWDAARQLRNNTHVRNLSPGERDDVANRISRMRRAVTSATKSFEKCVVTNFRTITANTTQLPNGQSFEQYVGAITNKGDIDPVDFNELSLQAYLVDDAQWASTLGNVFNTSLTSTTLHGAFARTHTGALIKKLGALNYTALQQAVAGTKLSFKSGTWSPCNGGFYEVAKLLVEEYRRGENGCMAQWNQRCEFSFPVYARDVADQIARRVSTVDEAKDLCLQYLGNDWDAGIGRVPASERTSLARFETFFKNHKAFVDQAVRNTPHASELPNSIGDRRSGLSYFGDPNRFGAGYSYEAEWGVNPIQWLDPSTKQQPCRLGAQVEGELDAWVNLFGVSKTLVDAGLKIRTAQTDPTLSADDRMAQLDAHVSLLGIEVFNEQNKPIEQGYDSDNEDSFDVSLVRTTVLLGFIPVTISAGFGFDYGYRLRGGIQQSACAANPTIAITGDIEPRAGANAFVEAYVDLFIFGAGVKGELTLVEARLPFTSGVSVQQLPAGWAIKAWSTLDLHLTELSGAIYFIVKAVGITVWEKELFSWPGIRQSIGLWNTTATFPGVAFPFLPADEV